MYNLSLIKCQEKNILIGTLKEKSKKNSHENKCGLEAKNYAYKCRMEIYGEKNIRQINWILSSFFQ